ncbi:DUF302 domain-containing protein [Halorubrum vacuolatum]|uniref:Uncharacterized conserved protein, DUF302 family n=1 Tax=Halorubrum vacuolatum TaxID=63740 RepID=A0A238WA82_HALVU|nr:DUF302 domain-containing protein [Halorubrum vacuolatum]SNR43486.1 Uncharacterized conserved protein, DUF302 family [Halorubrum vacuolatum]
MTLPFDPATLDPEDFGEKRATLAMDHEDAIEHVRAACTEEGFGVPVEFSPSELLNEKVDADRDPYYVLGACNPAMADRALDATDGRIGSLFPCNMVIQQVEPGRQVVHHVSIMKLARLLDFPDDEAALDAVIEDTGEMVETVFDRLEAV